MERLMISYSIHIIKDFPELPKNYKVFFGKLKRGNLPKRGEEYLFRFAYSESSYERLMQIFKDVFCDYVVVKLNSPYMEENYDSDNH